MQCIWNCEFTIFYWIIVVFLCKYCHCLPWPHLKVIYEQKLYFFLFLHNSHTTINHFIEFKNMVQNEMHALFCSLEEFHLDLKTFRYIHDPKVVVLFLLRSIWWHRRHRCIAALTFGSCSYGFHFAKMFHSIWAAATEWWLIFVRVSLAASDVIYEIFEILHFLPIKIIPIN